MSQSRIAIVILGASGDLAKRKLLPALNVLFQQGRLDGSSIVVGTGRSAFTDAEFRARFELSDDFREILFYHTGLDGIKDFIQTKGDFSRVIFFFSLPPQVYAKTAKEVMEAGFGKEASIIIEKPFGHDYPSAQELDREIHQSFDEEQIYRIDHYLGKETVQNILVFRFANTVIEPIWNYRHIDSIQITAFETLGTEGRAAYFDNSGIIRDMVQNHLMQLLCLMTMEPPVALSAEHIRAAKVNVLHSLKVEEVHRWQYEGYQNEEGVKPESETETYAELKFRIDNFRWNGVPIYMRTGKFMPVKTTEIAIQFRKLPPLLFNEDGGLSANRIVFRIQPNEGVFMQLMNKVPGTDRMLEDTLMKYTYREAFDEEIPEAYQRLLLDVLRGDQTLFVGSEESETSWEKFDGFLDKGEISLYRRGKVPSSRFNVDWIECIDCE